MRALAALAPVALLALAACAPADPAVRAEQNWARCQNGAPDQERVHACSSVIAAADTAPERRAAALLERGMQRSAQGEYGRAIADFGRALRIDPNLVTAYVERGQAHYQRGAYETAVADYDRALALQPGLQLAVERRDEALHGHETSLARQMTQLDAMIRQNPNNPGLWNNRCWVRAVAGEELDSALSDCNESLRLAPGDANTLDSRGLVHIKRGEYAAAVEDYNAALVAQPGRGHYLFGRGVARIALGQKQEGQADLVAAEQAEPGVTQAYQGYGVQT